MSYYCNLELKQLSPFRLNEAEFNSNTDNSKSLARIRTRWEITLTPGLTHQMKEPPWSESIWSLNLLVPALTLLSWRSQLKSTINSPSINWNNLASVVWRRKPLNRPSQYPPKGALKKQWTDRWASNRVRNCHRFHRWWWRKSNVTSPNVLDCFSCVFSRFLDFFSPVLVI